ncbi:MAG: sialate O-acetylesterase [Planctomycetota bacterium]
MVPKLRLLAPLAVSALLFGATAWGEHLQVVLMAGQSNMVGGAWTRDVPPGQQVTFPEVMYAHDSRSGSPPEDWGPLQPRYNSAMTARRFFGPEIGFGAEMVDNWVDNLAIIKLASGGSSLAEAWAPGADLREDFYAFVDQQLDGLTAAGHTYTVNGFIWVQGSADAATFANANAYDENLAQFVSELEGRYGEVTTVINRYHADAARANVDVLRANQRIAGNLDSDVYVVDTDDLLLLSDDIHFSTEMHLEVGRRLAQRYLEARRLRGDYNRDGVINGADFTVWRDSLDSMSDLAADGDGDGVVDLGDFRVWQEAIRSAGAASGSSAVEGQPTPEPASLGAVALALLAISARRGRRPGCTAAGGLGISRAR